MSRKRAPRKLFYRRSFLNRRGYHAGAYVIADVELTPTKGGTDVRASLDLADCNRHVSLDFYLDWEDGAGDRANVLHKARLLRDTVVAFTAARAAAVEQCVAGPEPAGRDRAQRGEVRP